MKSLAWIGLGAVLVLSVGAQRSLAAQVADTPASESTYVFVEKFPEVVKRVMPNYPLGARKLGIEGTVQLNALVGKDGKVKRVKIKQSVVGLNEAAIEAVCKWRFRPALSHGQPVAVWVTLPVNFRLR